MLDSPDQAPTVGQYRFNDITVAEGNRAIIAAIRDRLDIVAIDEVGPLEFRGGGWAPALEVALAEATESQEVILVVRPSLIRNLGELTKQRAELDYVLIESADGRDSAPVAETVTDHLPQEFQLPHPQGLRIRRLGNRPPT